MATDAKASVSGLGSGWRLCLPCAGLNLLVAAVAAGGAQAGTWLAGAEGSAVGLAAGLFAGLVGQAFGVEAIAARQSRR